MSFENQRGVIAESYEKLQALHILKSTAETHVLLKASPESLIRAVFQASEIALLNLSNLTHRALLDLKEGQINSAMVKLSWFYEFHIVLERLSLIPHKIGFTYDKNSPFGQLSIQESPAFQEYLQALKSFDCSAAQYIKNKHLHLEQTLANQSIDGIEFNLLHLLRIGNHTAKIWEHRLANVFVPTLVHSYEDFVGSVKLHEAVHSMALSGDTFFTQFRGLHQIPEILAKEINDCLEGVIQDIRLSHLQIAVEHMSWINVMTEGILVAMPSIVRNLSTSDYHKIRENLGLTSGSHSIWIRHQLFGELYEQLWKEISTCIAEYSGRDRKDSIETMLDEISQARFDSPQAWFIYLLCNECLKLRIFIDQWRALHLHLPRNTLGGNSTKSLTGSNDAIQMTEHMRTIGREKDPMLPLARSRKLIEQGVAEQVGALTNYLESGVSLDTMLLKATGDVTQQRFNDVQKRTGFFSQKCPFTPPH
jgi:tryptophan 2,3-dioxygenase